MERINLEGINDGCPVIDIPENENDFLTTDGRYFADGMVLVADMHNMLHMALDLRPDHISEEEAMFASAFVHSFLDVMRQRIETTLLEGQLARSGDA
jgi:hypothetical protein